MTFAIRKPVRPRRSIALLLLVAGALFCGQSCGKSQDSTGASSGSPTASAPEISSPEYARLGDGFLVWESDRGGAWRIWTRRLDGAGLRQLTPEESGRQHCCPHVSPDGKWVAYLSLARSKFESDDEEGELRLIRPDGNGDHTIAERAETYTRGHRAAIWHGADHLQFIDGGGNAVRLDLVSGKREKLAPPSGEGSGYLLDPTLTHGTTGLPTFSLYDAARHAITERTPFGGCEPYFSDDGRWGVWMAGAGGPLRALDLATRTGKTLFEKNDPRLGQQAYIYFPMLSNGSALLAFGASPNEHDHSKGNYDIFVVEVDPQTLDVLGTPLKYTSAPTPDRYPDVHVEPLPLGRAFGEAPFHVSLKHAQLGADARWDFGDGTPAATANGEHTYERAGSYAVEASTPDGAHLRGRVTVRPAAPPKALGVDLRQGRQLVVTFDEPIAPAAGGVQATLASGRKLVGAEVGADQRSLALSLAEDLTAGDRLHLAGVVDRAQRPNALQPVDLEIAPPRWPSARQSLILLWATAEQPNLVTDPAQGAERTYAFKARGRARLDHDQAMLLVGDGAFVAAEEAGKNLVELAKKSNELTFEATLTPAETGPSTSAIVATFARSRREPFLTLEQQGDALVFRVLRVKELEPPIRFAKLTAGKPVHVVVGYAPGRAVAYLDGARAVDSDAWQGDFFFWRPGALSIGAGLDGERPWKGVAEGLAVYDRLLSAEDVAESARRYAAERGRRAAVPQVKVLATQLRCSRVPTLDEIAPYRQGLAVCEYRVERVVSGTLASSTIRVARWVILDGQTLSTAAPSGPVELRLEPFNANPELESLYLSNDLGGASPSPLFYDPWSG